MNYLHACTSLLRGVVASFLGSNSGQGQAQCMHQRSTQTLEELLPLLLCVTFNDADDTSNCALSISPVHDCKIPPRPHGQTNGAL